MKLPMYLLIVVSLCIPADCLAEGDWQSYVDAGEAAREREDYITAEKYLIRALREAESFGAQDIRLGKSLDVLGSTYYEQRKYAQCEPLLLRSLAIREKAFGQNDLRVADILYRLAMVDVLTSKFEQAEPLVKRAAAIDQTEVKSGDPNAPTRLHRSAVEINNIGVVYLNGGKNSQAQEMFDLAIRLSPSYGLAFLNRSIARRNLGDVKAAEEDVNKWNLLRR